MTHMIDSIGDIADQFDAIVLDQWGVLHDGSAPYPTAVAALRDLAVRDVKLGVLSNSGKRAAPNADRIAAMGFDVGMFDCVMTSGEALWQMFAKSVDTRRLYPIEGKAGDAATWATGLDVQFADHVDRAHALLVMGLPDGSTLADYEPVLAAGIAAGLPLYCSNPDLTSPRGGGTYVMSPGVLAQSYADMGGILHLFGKPHRPIFDAMQATLNCAPEKILMVGDSLHHDIAGAQTAGWQSLLIRIGVHAPDLRSATLDADLTRLTKAAAMAMPDFSLPDLR